MDTVDIKESLPIAHPPGVVAVLGCFRPAEPQGYVGRVVRLRTPAGGSFAATIEGVRDHGATISVFFRGMTGADVPVGTLIDLGG